MKAVKDPEKVGFSRLAAAWSLKNLRMVEIGCGSGMLFWQYADLPRFAAGLDTDFDRLKEARKSHLSGCNDLILQANAQQLPFKEESIDLVLFASSM
jgi:ubiquinone/menaquinone biosynthesis C-methylase UbiE